MLLVHTGRKTGNPHATVAMTLSHDPETHEAVICSGCGNTDWILNIRARPALQVQIVRVPETQFAAFHAAISYS